MTNIYFKEQGKLVVYKSDMAISHKEAVELVKQEGHKPDGAVMVA